jgi:hypothetical protein
MSTIKLYKYWIDRLDKAKININEPKSTLTQLMDLDKAHGTGKISISSIKIIVSAIIWKLKNTTNKENVLKKYRKILGDLRVKHEIQNRDHKNIHGVIPEWKDVLKKRDDADENTVEKLVLALYTYLPPRRLLDYSDMKYVDKKPSDNDYNYYVEDEEKFVFNKYKTTKKYGQQEFDAPKELIKIMHDYIDSKNMKHGDFLLGGMNAHKLGYMLNRLCGAGVDNLRHSFVNHVYKKFNIPENEFMENLARYMGHSVETNLRYRKNI